MEKQILDYVLVPLGLIAMVAYHMWLLRQIVCRPSTTVVGINATIRHSWVLAMMEDPSKNGILAVQTLRNNIMASTLLASTAIMLSSLIAVLMTGGGGGGGGSRGLPVGVVYGDVSELGLSIKFFAILVCFLVAFLMNVQSIRYYSHAGILINVPTGGKTGGAAAEYVWRTVNKGSYFWSLGLRAFYLSFPLFLWIFGPIPMFCCCVLLVSLLYFVDVTFDFGGVFPENLQQQQRDHHCKDEEALICN